MTIHVKIGLFLSTIFMFSACTEDDRPKINGIHVLQRNHLSIVCFEDVKYILYSGGMTAKIDSETKLPERCTE